MPIDESLVEKLRGEVNKETDLFRMATNNVGGRDEHARICSAMDWIQMTARGYEVALKRLKKSDLGDTVAILAYVMISDTLVQGIDALHAALGIKNPESKRMFFKRSPNSLNLPYEHVGGYIDSKDSKVFNEIETDKEFFSKIRACFGAHVQDIGRKGKIYFASWSGREGDPNSIGVHLYNYEKYAGIILSVPIDEINSYIEWEYNKINDILPEISVICEDHRNELRTISIPSSNDIQEEIKILNNEARKRARGWEEYLLSELEEAYPKIMAEGDLGKEALLKNILKTIRDNLQNMPTSEDTLLFKIDSVHDLFRVYDIIKENSSKAPEAE